LLVLPPPAPLIYSTHCSGRFSDSMSVDRTLKETHKENKRQDEENHNKREEPAKKARISSVVVFFLVYAH
jgi:hypothetical protein